MLDFFLTNIVGLYYYSGTINGRENGGSGLGALNPFDSNGWKLSFGEITKLINFIPQPITRSTLGEITIFFINID